MNFTIYNIQDEIFVRSVNCDQSLISYQFDSNSEDYVEGEFRPSLYYPDVSQSPVVAVEKSLINYSIDKTTITADANDTCTIINVPDDCLMIVDDETEIETNNEFQFGTDLAKAYKLILKHKHYLDTVIEVIAQ